MNNTTPPLNGTEPATVSAEPPTATNKPPEPAKTGGLGLDLTAPPSGLWAAFAALELPLWPSCADGSVTLAEEVRDFDRFGKKSAAAMVRYTTSEGVEETPAFTNEFWTARQRQSNSLHEVSYRASFKAELPRFFIERLSRRGDLVLDPFGGRGTTALEAALLGRVPCSNDLNPLCLAFIGPRLRPPTIEELAARLRQIDLADHDEFREDLLAFYHPATLRQICSFKKYFLGRQAAGTFDSVDGWLRMVCMNRLTGQSPGFFSVRTLPPNQAVSVKSQLRINSRLNQTPPLRDVVAIILRKSQQLLRNVGSEVRRTLASVADRAILLNSPADRLRELPDGSVSLVVTSPPFLDVVDYVSDNWLRCWFVGIDPGAMQLRPTLFAVSPEGPSIFAPCPLNEVSEKNEFAAVARLICAAQGAIAVVLAIEAWVLEAKPGERLDPHALPSASPHRREFISLSGEALGRTYQQ